MLIHLEMSLNLVKNKEVKQDQIAKYIQLKILKWAVQKSLIKFNNKKGEILWKTSENLLNIELLEFLKLIMQTKIT